jgi:hypothetical protein
MKKFLLLITNAVAVLSQCIAQTDITSVSTTYTPSALGTTYTGPYATGGNSTYNSGTFQYNYGTNAGTTNNILTLNSFNTATNLYVPVATNPTIILRRNSVSPNNSILYYQGNRIENSGGFPYIFNLERPYEESMETAFSGLSNFNAGTDNLFTNVGDGNNNNNSIERADVIFSTPRLVVDATKEGIAIFERGELSQHDAFQVAVIKSVDGSNNPTSYYAGIKKLNTGTWGNANLIASAADIDYYIVRKPLPSATNLQISASVDQNMGGTFMKFSDFGIPNNEIIIGYSIMATDVATTNGTDFLNYNNITTAYNTNTNNSNGGIDLVAATAIYEQAIVASTNTAQLTANAQNQSIILNWNADFANLANMELQKSTDGTNFNSVKTTQPNTTNQYQTSEVKTAYLIYYRIKYNLQDGSVVYSNTVKISSTGNNGNVVLLSANPVIGDAVSLKIVTANSEMGSIVLFDASGRKLSTQNIRLQKGNNYITVTRPKGFYGQAILQVISEHLCESKQMQF